MDTNQQIEKIFNFLLFIFLLLVFSLPRVLQVEKIGLLAILLVGFFMKLKLKVNIHLFVSYLFFFIPTFIVAIIRGNEGEYITDAFKIYFLFPIMIYFIFMTFRGHAFQDIFIKSAKIAIIIISSSTLVSFLYGLGLSPININSIFYEKEDYVGIHEGYYHIVNSPLSYMLFLVPVYFFNRVELNFKNFDFYLFIFAFAMCLLSGRRVMILPFALLMLLNLKQMKYFVFAGAGLFVLGIFTGKINMFFLDTYLDRMSSAINSTGDSMVREEQRVYFWKHISESPFFGFGLGGYMEDYSRNAEFKTAYESTFHYLIFIMGIPLATILVCFYLYLAKLVKNNTVFDISFRNGFLIGCLSLLVGSYTNPYWLSSFDYCLPLAALFRLTQKK
ncbi:hypothetical protein OZ668_10600 [Elizabethkingia sp. HX XZB]|uniref:hypothetical protein n=1 Tax=Elizabethkingia sp. HX XZB TaxID=3003193 RepID=UPI002A248173|nr:hypothetical protein [Elizabethkingia sp. HX XZB]MDX8568439.1 hypothetical protein [Elizabethkingia sp. HX XZB]